MTDCGCFAIEYIESFCDNWEYLLKGMPHEIEKTGFFHSTLAAKRRDLLI